MIIFLFRIFAVPLFNFGPLMGFIVNNNRNKYVQNGLLYDGVLFHQINTCTTLHAYNWWEIYKKKNM